MHVEWVVTCRFAESDGGSGTIVGAGTDVLFLPQIPGPAGTFIAVRLAATAEELEPGQQHELVTRIVDPGGRPARAPDGTEVPAQTIQIAPQAPVQQLVPGWLVNPLLAYGAQWWVHEPGSYTIELSVGEGEPRNSPIHVLPMSDMPQPG